MPDRPDVVDVAAGTGKLTRTLAQLAGSLVAVEPDPALRAVLERELPDVTALEGTAEELPLADGERRRRSAPDRPSTGSTSIARSTSSRACCARAASRSRPGTRRPRTAPGTTRSSTSSRRQPRPPARAPTIDWPAALGAHPRLRRPARDRRAPRAAARPRGLPAPARHAQHRSTYCRRPSRRADRQARRGGRRAGRVRRRRQLRDPVALRALRAAAPHLTRPPVLALRRPAGYTVPVTETALPIRQ